MVVGVLSFDLLVNGASNLKEKRSCVKSLVEKVRARFNVSVSEVDYQDLWKRASIGIAVVGSDSKALNSLVDRITDFVYSAGDFEVLKRELEILRY